jgi:hypothetical protein
VKEEPFEMMLRRKHGGGMPAEKRSRRERERRDGVINTSSQAECNEDYRVFFWSQKAFPQLC